MSVGQDREPREGRRIFDGRFHIEARLGGGAFGTVYRAGEYVFGERLRSVAIKFTQHGNLAPSEAADLLHEGRIMARLVAECRDPDARKHLLQVYGMGLSEEFGRRGYILMELVSGVRLLDHIRGGGLPGRTLRRYFRELCSALACCHAFDISHGDLKPDNILVDSTGTIRVADFGRAKIVQRSRGWAAGGGGALAYTAPETLSGRCGPKSDLYSLGLIMYEALTGEAPHLRLPEPAGGGYEMHYLRAKSRLQFPSIADRVSELHPDPVLYALVERCCSFREEDRPDSVAAMLAELDGETPAAAPEGEAWRVRVERDLARGDARGALDYLESCAASGPEVAAYSNILRSSSGVHEAALEEGGALFEQTRGGGLEPGLRERLRQALLASACALENGPVAEYYRGQVS